MEGCFVHSFSFRLLDLIYFGFKALVWDKNCMEEKASVLNDTNIKLGILVEWKACYIYKVCRCYINIIILTQLVDNPKMPKELLKMFQV